jgi:hypothetical protein
MPSNKATDACEGPRFWRRLRCTLRLGHDPVHHPLGGFRCSRCGKVGANLEQLGFEDEGYVTEVERRRIGHTGDGGNRAA